jgi:hypothetical protein
MNIYFVPDSMKRPHMAAQSGHLTRSQAVYIGKQTVRTMASCGPNLPEYEPSSGCAGVGGYGESGAAPWLTFMVGPLERCAGRMGDGRLRSVLNEQPRLLRRSVGCPAAWCGRPGPGWTGRRRFWLGTQHPYPTAEPPRAGCALGERDARTPTAEMSIQALGYRAAVKPVTARYSKCRESDRHEPAGRTLNGAASDYDCGPVTVMHCAVRMQVLDDGAFC